MNEVLNIKQPHHPLWLRPTAFILVCAMMVWMLSSNISWVHESQQAAALDQDQAAVKALLTHVEPIDQPNAQPSSQTAATAVFSEKMQMLADAYAIAREAIENGQYKAALVQIDSCLALDDASNKPLSVDLWLKKGALHAMLGDHEQAVAGMDRALAIAPETAEAWLAKSQILSDSDQLTGAIQSLMEYIKLVPTDIRVYANLAQLRFNVGLYAAAARDCTTYLESSNGSDAAVYFLRGNCHVQLSSFQSAGDDFLLALQYGYDAAECYAQVAYCQMMLKNYPAALAYCTSYLEKYDAKNGAMLVLRGSCLIQMEDYKAAASDYLAAVNLGYQKAECAEQAAYCQLMLKDYAAALQSGEQALQFGSNRDTLYQQLGVAALGLQQTEKAVAYFTKSIELNPDLTMNHYYRGVCRMSLKDYEEAERDFSLSLARGDMAQVSFYNRGICRIYLKEYKDAEKDMELAMNTGSDEAISKSAAEVLKQLNQM